eukprot:364236-Chlamydomonas_euryale.AAC.4
MQAGVAASPRLLEGWSQPRVAFMWMRWRHAMRPPKQVMPVQLCMRRRVVPCRATHSDHRKPQVVCGRARAPTRPGLLHWLLLSFRCPAQCWCWRRPAAVAQPAGAGSCCLVGNCQRLLSPSAGSRPTGGGAAAARMGWCRRRAYR